jgi:hypothetical protein
MKLFGSRSDLPEVEFCDSCRSVCDAVSMVEAAREKTIVQALSLFPIVR